MFGIFNLRSIPKLDVNTMIYAGTWDRLTLSLRMIGELAHRRRRSRARTNLAYKVPLMSLQTTQNTTSGPERALLRESVAAASNRSASEVHRLARTKGPMAVCRISEKVD